MNRKQRRALGMTGPGRERRPCCGKCRMTGLVRSEAGEWGCPLCDVAWDGSEVSPDKLPAIVEDLIAEGACTRDEAYRAFIECDELADATVAGDITFEQGTRLVEDKALAMRDKRRG